MQVPSYGKKITDQTQSGKKNRATSSKQDDEIWGSEGLTCNYFASDTQAAILVARLLGPLLLQTAGRWTWDIQSLSLNWQTGRNTCCNNLWRPLHMVLLFSWPDCLVLVSTHCRAVRLMQHLGFATSWAKTREKSFAYRIYRKRRKNMKWYWSNEGLFKLIEEKKVSLSLLPCPLPPFSLLLFSQSSARHSWGAAFACLWPN